ncbi:MAG: transglycosylase SLT domain-containing protein [Crocinitomicaceae bacterium]|nr:transglycosylase SLT domain-containing protein [Flavobacteriales bacterium]NQZ37188.1 transglycosylase SLT domain-containing protein [Crocinitomicaceae bacterium]
MNKLLILSSFLLLSISSMAQYSGTAPKDTLVGDQMINAIEQSLNLYYAEYSSSQNYDSIISALNYEASDMPEFDDSIYCARLNVMNEMSPFQLECNEQTLSTIRFFVKKRRGFARVVLGRSKIYFDMFEEKLAEHGLPIELKYLAVIESGLRPQVKSRAGALGLWQFMYRTGKMYGLKENSYVDERMDPELATDAACRYLKKLYGIYNDWNLALAAYNAGPGNVNKAIRRSGNKLTYWEVRPFLPRETQGYVPNFIAAAYLLTYHAEHNIIPAEAEVQYYQLDTMCLTKGVHFESISKVLGIELEEVKRLNPIYKRGYIPYSEGQYCVTLPLEQIGQLVSLQDSLYQEEMDTYIQPKPRVVNNTQSTTKPKTSGSYNYHKVRSRETLGVIASRYGMSVRELQRINGLNSTRIYVGQRLKVKQGTGTVTATNKTPAATKKYYSVRSGDTFGKIAQRHRLSQSQLKRLNPRINIERLKIGQKIRVR